MLISNQKLLRTLRTPGHISSISGVNGTPFYVKNLLVGVKVRWKKLVRKVDETGRLLQQAYREDKRVS